MYDQTGLLNWTYFYQDKAMDMVNNMELEEVKHNAREELKSKDLEISHLKDLLNTAIKERDEAQANCQKLSLENLFLQSCNNNTQQQQQYSSGISSIEQEDFSGRTTALISISSSDSDESIISSAHNVIHTKQHEIELELVTNKPLPEKGKLLDAVMKAGPLLQTLLLAGPLPQWRHPPPKLDAYQIPPPPVVIPTLMSAYQNNCGKRVFSSEGYDSSPSEFKHQRVSHY